MKRRSQILKHLAATDEGARVLDGMIYALTYLDRKLKPETVESRDLRVCGLGLEYLERLEPTLRRRA